VGALSRKDDSARSPEELPRSRTPSSRAPGLQDVEAGRHRDEDAGEERRTSRIGWKVKWFALRSSRVRDGERGEGQRHDDRLAPRRVQEGHGYEHSAEQARFALPATRSGRTS